MKLMMTLQRPLIRTVIQDSFEHVRAYLVFTNAFPSFNVAHTFARDSLMAGAGANRPAAEKIYQRLQEDEDYINKMASVVRLGSWSSTDGINNFIRIGSLVHSFAVFVAK